MISEKSICDASSPKGLKHLHLSQSILIRDCSLTSTLPIRGSNTSEAKGNYLSWRLSHCVFPKMVPKFMARLQLLFRDHTSKNLPSGHPPPPACAEFTCTFCGPSGLEMFHSGFTFNGFRRSFRALRGCRLTAVARVDNKRPKKRASSLASMARSLCDAEATSKCACGGLVQFAPPGCPDPNPDCFQRTQRCLGLFSAAFFHKTRRGAEQMKRRKTGAHQGWHT